MTKYLKALMVIALFVCFFGCVENQVQKVEYVATAPDGTTLWRVCDRGECVYFTGNGSSNMAHVSGKLEPRY